MTATTSKLGADMTDEQINTTALRDHAGKGWAGDCLIPKSTVKRIADELDSLRQLLARQPAAIVAHAPGCGDGEDCHACANLDRSLYAASPAAPLVEQYERGDSFEVWIESIPPLTWESWGRREAAHAAWIAHAASTSANVAQGMTEAEIRESNAVLDQALSDFYAATANVAQGAEAVVKKP